MLMGLPVRRLRTIRLWFFMDGNAPWITRDTMGVIFFSLVRFWFACFRRSIYGSTTGCQIEPSLVFRRDIPVLPYQYLALLSYSPLPPKPESHGSGSGICTLCSLSHCLIRR